MPRYCLETDFIDFVFKFQELTGIDIPQFPSKFLTQTNIQRLQAAHSIAFQKVSSLDKMSLLLSNTIVLSKLTELTFELENHENTENEKNTIDTVLS